MTNTTVARQLQRLRKKHSQAVDSEFRDFSAYKFLYRNAAPLGFSLIRAGSDTFRTLKSQFEELLSEFVQCDYERVTDGRDLTKVKERDFDHLVEVLTKFCLDAYNPEKFSKMQSSRGARRRKHYVRELVKCVNMSIKESAQKLGCSERTISNLRRDAKKMPIQKFIRAIARSRVRLVPEKWSIKKKFKKAHKVVCAYAEALRADFTPSDVGLKGKISRLNTTN